ncbi:MAG: DNA-directed RNA polymerase subunit omega [Candidatus Margulisbacteria bacterium]|nr:DNA-directed RNA polymerase subunit omega [Candidatus Margulisiibacteriota bacterium]
MRALVLEELLEKVQNRFLLVVAAARRARQIKDGAVKLIDAPEDESPVIVALDEILEDKINIEVGEIKGQVPSATSGRIMKVSQAKEVKSAKEKVIKKLSGKKTKKEHSKKKKSRSMAA